MSFARDGVDGAQRGLGARLPRTLAAPFCALALAGMAGCVGPDTEQCAWDLECPAGYACSRESYTCVPRAQHESCAGQPDLTACTYPDAVGLQQCLTGQCTPGTVWETMDTGATGFFRGVWGLADDQVYAVGPAGSFRFDGTTWRVVQMGYSPDLALVSVWGASATDLYVSALGYDPWHAEIYHFDGTAWGRVAYIDGADPYDLWGSAGDDVYLASNCSAEGCGALLHFDGTTWAAVDLGDLVTARPQLVRVWGTSATDVTVVERNRGLLHFDGQTWQAVDLPGESQSYLGIAGRSATDVYVLGTTLYTTELRYQLWHFDGQTWARWHHGSLPGMVSLWDLWTGPGWDVYLAGDDSILLRCHAAGCYPMSVSDSSVQLNRMWGSDEHLTVVGERGYAFRLARPEALR